MAYERNTNDDARTMWGEPFTVPTARRALAGLPRRLRAALKGRSAEALAALLLVVLAANLLVAISRKSITNDEVVHIPAGYYHLVAGDFLLNNEHPPLIKMWAALPLLLVQPDEPPPPTNLSENFMERTFGYHARFWLSNRARFRSVSLWPRLMMVPLTLALGLAVFLFTRRLFGPRAALLALALLVFEPTVLAHGRVVHTDAPAALVYLLFFAALYAYAERPTYRRALLVALALACALLTKFSMVVLLPVAAAGVLWQLSSAWRRGDSPRLKRTLVHAGLVAMVVLLAVNAAYRFQSPPLEASDVRWVTTQSGPVGQDRAILKAVAALSNVVPTYYLFGFYNVATHNQFGHPSFLFGEHSNMGWWYYFPAAFALKTTLPFLFVSAAALLWALWRAVFRRELRFALVLAPLAVYAFVSLTGHINIGLRHFLPAFPFLFILSGVLLERLWLAARWRTWARAVVVLALSLHALEAARVFPDYTPYMNQLASARPHYEYLSDSNVEWGDDVGELADYLKARGETRVRAALSGGWATLGLYGVEYVNLMPGKGERVPETRYTAIGASFLNGSTVLGGDAGTGRETEEQRVNFFAPYRARQPEAIFGGSIYLYREQE